MMEALARILQDKAGGSALVRGVNAAMAIEAANMILKEMFGASIAESVQAAYVKNEALCLACLSSTAAQEIRLREAELVERLNAKIPAMTIKKVRYLV